MSIRLSVIVITYNEAANIERCLHSVTFADEVIVLDSGSTDSTVSLSRACGAQVFETDWPGYGKQKNRALAKATGEWVLSLDADEEVTPALASAIQTAMKVADVDVYAMHRLNFVLNQPLYYGSSRQDWVLRLFRRGCAQFDNVPVHESLQVGCQAVKRLKGYLNHYTLVSLSQWMEKTEKYTSLHLEKIAHKPKPAFSRILLSAAWSFFHGYVLRGGFLDGKIGFVSAGFNAQYTYLKYLKKYFNQNSA